MTEGKGYAGISYATRDTIETVTNRFIESENEVERTAARMLKALTPLMIEILESGDIKMVSGFVRGVSDIVASMVVSLPPNMRDGVGNAIRGDIERALNAIPEEVARDGKLPEQQLNKEGK